LGSFFPTTIFFFFRRKGPPVVFLSTPKRDYKGWTCLLGGVFFPSQFFTAKTEVFFPFFPLADGISVVLTMKPFFCFEVFVSQVSAQEALKLDVFSFMVAGHQPRSGDRTFPFSATVFFDHPG